MSNPLVSIIIPTYNRAHLIGETLDSIVAQTYKNWECIIVDDGSTDNTEEIVNKYIKKDNRFQYHLRPEHHKPGGNGARNYGFELSKGEFIQWFDSDDLMHPEKVQKQVEQLMDSNYNFSVSQTSIFENNFENNLGLRCEKISSESPLLDFIKRELVFLTPSVIFKKSFLLSNNLKFNEALKSAQEWELFSKVLYFCDVYFADQNIYSFVRKHEESISHSEIDFIIENKKVNYFYARLEVFNFLKTKKVDNKKEILLFLKNYMVDVYLFFLLKRKMNKCIELYRVFFKENLSFNKKVQFIAISIFLIITGRGYTFKKYLYN